MHWQSNRQLYIAVFAIICCLLIVQKSPSAARTNIAIGAQYTFAPTARYEHTVDPADTTKLTDGKFASGHFWTSRSRTVGWLQPGTIRINIDLGSNFTVNGIAIDTARGNKSGVSFPSRVDMFASNDGEHFAYLGNLLKGKDRSDGPYLVSKFEASDLKVTARYVTLFIVPKGDYTFIDEIEIFGDKAVGNQSGEYPLARKGLQEFQKVLVATDHEFAALDYLRQKLIAKSKVANTEALKSDLHGSPLLGETARSRANPHVYSLQQQKSELFALHANYLANRFAANLLVWRSNPWASFTPIDSPHKEDLIKSEISLDVMQGGTVSEVICLTNAGREDKILKLFVQQSAGQDNSPRISLREAVPVNLADGSVKTDPLILLPDNEISLQRGESKQIWLTVSALNTQGTSDAKLLISSLAKDQEKVEVPIRMQVYPVSFPLNQKLQVNAWSYLNWRPIKGIPQQAVADLHDHHVNVFVLHPAQIPWPKKNNYSFNINAIEFNNVIKRHRAASKFLLYLEFKNENFRKINYTAKFLSSEWQELFKKWIVLWVAHMKSLGLGYEQFAFYPLDEPQNGADVKIIREVSRLLKEVDPNLQVYSTIDTVDRLNYRDFIALTDAVDIVQISENDLGKDRGKQLVSRGKTVWTYGAYGGKKADPIAGYRLQAWRAFKHGATGIGFWAYADTGSTGTAWDDFDGTRPDFSVIYEGKNQIISSKRWEAWREGVEDYELLRLAKMQLHTEQERKNFWEMIDYVLKNPQDYNRFQIIRRSLLEIASRQKP